MKDALFDLLVVLIRIGVVFSFCMGLVVVFTWVERKGAAYIQDRRGPNRVLFRRVRTHPHRHHALLPSWAPAGAR